MSTMTKHYIRAAFISEIVDALLAKKDSSSFNANKIK